MYLVLQVMLVVVFIESVTVFSVRCRFNRVFSFHCVLNNIIKQRFVLGGFIFRYWFINVAIALQYSILEYLIVLTFCLGKVQK